MRGILTRLALALAVCLPCAGSPPAQAHPIIYELTLHATSGTLDSYTFATDPSGQTHLVGQSQESAAGDTFYGLFGIDSSLLASDGTEQQGAPMLFLTLQISDDIWSYNFPGNNSFAGFRGPGDFSYEPGFDVVDGQLVGMCGGVFGPSDVPFVDFAQCSTPDYSNVFFSEGEPHVLLDGTFTFPDQVAGTFAIRRVPEPTTLSLFVLGLAGLGLMRRRKPI